MSFVKQFKFRSFPRKREPSLRDGYYWMTIRKSGSPIKPGMSGLLKDKIGYRSGETRFRLMARI